MSWEPWFSGEPVVLSLRERILREKKVVLPKNEGATCQMKSQIPVLPTEIKSKTSD